jgi:pilus assembly protein Flp/PilA
MPLFRLESHCILEVVYPAVFHLRRLSMLYLPKNEEGQGLVEYALILVLVAIVVIAILALLGPQIGNVFSRITSGLTGT